MDGIMTETLESLLLKIQVLGERFSGYSIDYRRFYEDETDWEHPFRVSLKSSKARPWKMTEYGNTLEEALEKIIHNVEADDIKNNKRK